MQCLLYPCLATLLSLANHTQSFLPNTTAEGKKNRGCAVGPLPSGRVGEEGHFQIANQTGIKTGTSLILCLGYPLIPLYQCGPHEALETPKDLELPCPKWWH